MTYHLNSLLFFAIFHFCFYNSCDAGDAVFAEKSEDNPLLFNNRVRQLLTRARSDIDTIHTISITFHYTEQAKKFAPNIWAYIKNHVDSVNEGFANSGISIRAKIHCVRLSKILEGRNSDEQVLRIFFEADTLENLLQSADAAILYTRFRHGGCGVAFLRSYQGGPPPIGVVSQACQGDSGKYSLGHELGHILGVRHNRAVDPRDHEDDGAAHGYLIPGTNGRTLMAYDSDGLHWVWLNYYSNKAHEYEGTKMGNDLNNAYKTIVGARILASSYGDESITDCSDVPESEGSPSSSDPHASAKREEDTCRDKGPDLPCESYKRKDFCMLPYVSTMCTKTCGFCGMEDFVPCSDYDKSCGSWKKGGLCESFDFGEWVTRVCPKSCAGC